MLRATATESEAPVGARPERHARSRSVLWPREHGAYGQLGFPLVCALAAGRPGIVSALLALSVIASFLAHESLLVIAGRRGARLARERAGEARAVLLALGAAAALCQLAALVLAARAVRLAWLVPVSLGVGCLLVALRGRERSTGGEVGVAITLSSVALPLALAAGVAGPTALSLAGVWALASASQTMAVRGLIARARVRDGDARLAWLAAVISSLGAGILCAGAAVGLVAPLVAFATWPAAAVSAWLATHPPRPHALRTVGWSLMACSAVTGVLLVWGSR